MNLFRRAALFTALACLPCVGEERGPVREEARIAFDRPLDRDVPRETIEIRHGNYVRAGDRFERIRPGYEVVKKQQAAPVRHASVSSVRLSDDRRTLILKTRDRKSTL